VVIRALHRELRHRGFWSDAAHRRRHTTSYTGHRPRSRRIVAACPDCMTSTFGRRHGCSLGIGGCGSDVLLPSNLAPCTTLKHVSIFLEPTGQLFSANG